MTNRFYDLTFERLASGTIRLKQSAFDEDSTIDVHPEQLMFIARRLCGMKPETTEKVAEFEPEHRDDEQQEGHNASRPIHPPAAIAQAKKTQPSVIAEGGEQLGLEV